MSLLPIPRTSKLDVLVPKSISPFLESSHHHLFVVVVVVFLWMDDGFFFVCCCRFGQSPNLPYLLHAIPFKIFYESFFCQPFFLTSHDIYMRHKYIYRIYMFCSEKRVQSTIAVGCCWLLLLVYFPIHSL